MKTGQTDTVVIDHMGITVRDLKWARAFYSAALGALGMRINMDVTSAFGFGSRDQKIFWLSGDKNASGGGHYAFRVDHRDEVDAFYAAALAAGGRDNGAPGPRPNYGPNYYAAFVMDKDENNIEVICYAAPAKSTKSTKSTKPTKPAKSTKPAKPTKPAKSGRPAGAKARPKRRA
jgi:catechol 2,3-dioxygenase-like lactoylglutathione lyase family enzyme